jgi:hypothetical protein
MLHRRFNIENVGYLLEVEIRVIKNVHVDMAQLAMSEFLPM